VEGTVYKALVPVGDAQACYSACWKVIWTDKCRGVGMKSGNALSGN